jgi:hypothetical protein
MSRDGRRVYYLLRESPDSASSDLRSIDLASGKVERLLPGMPIAEDDIFGSNYDISRDEREVYSPRKNRTAARRSGWRLSIGTRRRVSSRMTARCRPSELTTTFSS